MALAVTGVGLVTSLGLGATGSCAAIRAGLAMPEELDIEVSEGEGQAGRALGYPARLVADGFLQTGAWVRLGSAAIEDLRHSAALPPDSAEWFWSRTGVMGAVPLVNPSRFGWGLEELPDAVERSFLQPVLGLALPRASPGKAWNALGHVSAAAVLARAEKELAERHVDRVILAGADSYVDPLTLAWLQESARLKSAECSTGLMPGEAGAALMVESLQSARLRKAEALGSIESVASAGCQSPDSSGDEEPPPMPAAPPLGRALAEVVRRVLPPRSPGSRFRGDIYLDLNGEDWKADAWGHAVVHLTREVDFDRCRTVLPAESLGETGAASGFVAIALALYGFHEDGDDEAKAMVVSISDDGMVSAIRLGA